MIYRKSYRLHYGSHFEYHPKSQHLIKGYGKCMSALLKLYRTDVQLAWPNFRFYHCISYEYLDNFTYVDLFIKRLCIFSGLTGRAPQYSRSSLPHKILIKHGRWIFSINKILIGDVIYWRSSNKNWKCYNHGCFWDLNLCKKNLYYCIINTTFTCIRILVWRQ